jgi:recombination protein RecT
MTNTEQLKEKLAEQTGKSDGSAPTSTAVAKTGPAAVPVTMKGLKSSQVKGIFDLYKDQIAQAVPKHLTADRIIQLSTTLITRTPELADCSTQSLLGAVMQASILGFEPVAALGQCYLLPFNNTQSGKKEVQFIIGYRGMIDLARNSGQIKDIYAQVVYSNDSFSYEFGLEPKLVHKPAMTERGHMTHVYAVAHFVNGGFAFEVMSKFDVDKIKGSSKAGNSKYSPWNSGFYDEMAKKTVIRRLFKMLPTSVSKVAETSDEKVIENTAFKSGELDLNAVQSVAPESIETIDESTGEIFAAEKEA